MTYSSSPIGSVPMCADRPTGLTLPGQLIPAHGEQNAPDEPSAVPEAAPPVTNEKEVL